VVEASQKAVEASKKAVEALQAVFGADGFAGLTN
jgi:hypothetical protein